MTMDRTPLPASLERYPDLDTWIRVERDGTVMVRTGKVELGQGLRAAIARIAAEELDVDLSRVHVAMADTAEGPDELLTVGSASIEESGAAVRRAAAEARHELLLRAGKELGVSPHRLRVDDGSIYVDSDVSPRIDYWQLLAGGRFERKISGAVPYKAAASHRVVGRSLPRDDLRAKLTGGAFVHDLATPDTLFARVVRTPVSGARLCELRTQDTAALSGVRAIVRDGSFVGVVADREEVAIEAARRLRDAARWSLPEATRDHVDDVFEGLLSRPRQSFWVRDGVPVDDPIPAPIPLDAPRSQRARYARPFQMHGAIGPSAALAQLEDGHLTVWSHSQGVSLLRRSLAHALDLPVERIRVVHVDGPGCYGHNGADDVALDAALLARAVPGERVLTQWSREDEHRFEPYGPPMVMDLAAVLDASGRIVRWSHEVYSYTHLRPTAIEPGRSSLLAAWDREPPLLPPVIGPWRIPQGGIHRNAPPIYALPDVRVVKHFVEDPPVRTSTLRSLGAFGNLFAIESFMDELAERAGRDPIAFRLEHLQDPRARAVLEAVVERAGWSSARPAGVGRGVALGRYKGGKCYAAVVVEAQVEGDTGAVHLGRVFIAADAGEVVDPDGLISQLEGGVVQAASWTLKEAVRFRGGRPQSHDWDSYPILRFSEAPPQMSTVLLDRPGLPYLGAGEATQGLAPAAIANAIANAAGVRLREIPFTPDRVRARLAANTSLASRERGGI